MLYNKYETGSVAPLPSEVPPSKLSGETRPPPPPGYGSYQRRYYPDASLGASPATANDTLAGDYGISKSGSGGAASSYFGGGDGLPTDELQLPREASLLSGMDLSEYVLFFSVLLLVKGARMRAIIIRFAHACAQSYILLCLTDLSHHVTSSRCTELASMSPRLPASRAERRSLRPLLPLLLRRRRLLRLRRGSRTLRVPRRRYPPRRGPASSGGARRARAVMAAAATTTTTQPQWCGGRTRGRDRAPPRR
jgi:hypothetical protein